MILSQARLPLDFDELSRVAASRISWRESKSYVPELKETDLIGRKYLSSGRTAYSERSLIREAASGKRLMMQTF